jgi:hypothetical protein
MLALKGEIISIVPAKMSRRMIATTVVARIFDERGPEAAKAKALEIREAWEDVVLSRRMKAARNG